MPSAVMPRRKPKWKDDSRGTPPEVYEPLDREFNFTFDPCPLDASATAGASLWGKCGLAKPWMGERVFCNPPYSDIAPWLMKAPEALIAVYLVPVKTDLGWWHDLVMGKAREVRFIRKRLRFAGMSGGAPFASALLIYGEEHIPRYQFHRVGTIYTSWTRPDRKKVTP